MDITNIQKVYLFIAGILTVLTVYIWKIKSDVKIEDIRMANYNECMRVAYNDYRTRVNNHCMSIFRYKNCMLPKFVIDKYDSDLEIQRNRCLELFKAK